MKIDAMRRVIIILIGTALAFVAGGPPANAIIGGSTASEAPPSLGSLQIELAGDSVTPADHRCGVSVIAPQWVVTASHCAALGNAVDVKTGAIRAKVRIGSTDTRSGGELVGVDRFYRLGTPADARARDYSWLLRDIAVLRLERPVRAAPIAIATRTPSAGTPARIMGWGSTCTEADRLRDPQCYPATLRSAETVVREIAACDNISASDRPLPLCIGGTNRNPTVANADSGSPAWVRENGNWVLAGVVSGPGTNDEKGPGLYMDLTRQRAWIDGIVNGTNRPAPDPVPAVAGAVRLGSCVGSIVRAPGAGQDSPALVLTNGHCVTGDRPAPGEARSNEPADRTMIVVGDNGTAVTSLRADRLVYATMTGTDIAVYRVDSTYRQLEERGAKVYDLPTAPVRPGDRFTMNTGSRIQSCRAVAVVPTLREAAWQQTNSVRYAGGGACTSFSGESGSPLIAPDGRTVVAVNNTSNEDGQKCSEGNPCEVNSSGAVTAVQGRAYGQQIDGLSRCLTGDSTIALNRPGCDLADAA